MSEVSYIRQCIQSYICDKAHLLCENVFFIRVLYSQDVLTYYNANIGQDNYMLITLPPSKSTRADNVCEMFYNGLIPIEIVRNSIGTFFATRKVDAHIRAINGTLIILPAETRMPLQHEFN